jgi:UDP-glucuronate 4-epimerase
MKFLVTGGAGFIGSHLCERLLEKEADIVCLDNFNNYYDPEIKRYNIKSLLDHPRFRLAELDILDANGLKKLFEQENFDTVVHLAARAGVRPSIQNPVLYQKVNVEGTVNLLEASVASRIAKFVMASSSSVYGKNKKVPFSESDNVDFPISPYAATKKACELLAFTYHSLHQLPVTCLRFFTVYGPRQRPDMAIHKFTRKIYDGEEIPVFGDGTSRRDYTYITDILDGIMSSIENCENYHIYNLGESQTIELSNLITLIEKALDKKARINRMPDQPGDVPITYADISRARKELGFDPVIGIEQGICQFVDWFLKQCK